MLQKFNEKIQGTIAWVIIGIVAFTFTLFGIDSYLQSRHTSVNEVEVNGIPISKQAFDINFRRARQVQEASSQSLLDDKVLKQQILNDMISTVVNKNAAQKVGFGLDASIANNAILRIPEFQKDGQFSQDIYQQALNNAFFTPQSFLNEVRQGMLLNQQRFAFMGTSFALPDEVQQFVKLYGQKRNYRYVTIPAKTFLNRASVSNDEIKAYFNAHESEFNTEERIKLEYVKLAMSDLQKTITPTEDELKAYYETNQASYMTPTKWSYRFIKFDDEAKAKAFHEAALANPETFAKHADAKIQESVDAKGTILDPDLLKAAQPGDMLGPFKDQKGAVLFQVIGYEDAVSEPYDKVKSEVRTQYISDKALIEYARLQDELAEQSYQTPDMLEPVAKALGLKTEKTAWLTKEGAKGAVTDSPAVLKAAFSHDVLHLGNNSQPIQLDEETIVVVRVDEYKPSVAKSLPEVRESIQSKLKQDKAIKLAEQLGEQLIQADENHGLDEQMFVTHGLKWQNVTDAYRESSLAEPEVNHLAFTISKVQMRSGVALADDAGFVVVELQKVEDGELSQLDKEQLESISQQISANFGSVDYDLYVSNLIDKAKVVRH